MTHRQIYKVNDNRLTITLPDSFRDKRVMVIVDDEVIPQNDKMNLMKLAAKDPLYLQDLKEVNDDFNGLEHETL